MAESSDPIPGMKMDVQKASQDVFFFGVGAMRSRIVFAQIGFYHKSVSTSRPSTCSLRTPPNVNMAGADIDNDGQGRSLCHLNKCIDGEWQARTLPFFCSLLNWKRENPEIHLTGAHCIGT